MQCTIRIIFTGNDDAAVTAADGNTCIHSTDIPIMLDDVHAVAALIPPFMSLEASHSSYTMVRWLTVSAHCRMYDAQHGCAHTHTHTHTHYYTIVSFWEILSRNVWMIQWCGGYSRRVTRSTSHTDDRPPRMWFVREFLLTIYITHALSLSLWFRHIKRKNNGWTGKHLQYMVMSKYYS